MRYNRNIVPSIFTMLNLFFGFFAIVNALQGKFVAASWLIILAAVWDGMDGKIARLTNTHSDFGIQFDSITDVVSFGVAPSILIYKVFLYQLGAAGVIISFLPLLFGAIRLARFNVNVEGFEKENFTGLPIPAMAVTLSAYVIFNYDLWEGLRYARLLIPLALFLCFLMVSNVEYQALPKFSFREGKRNSLFLVLLILVVGSIIVFRQKVMFPIMFAFVLLYFLRSLVISNKLEEEDDEVFDVSLPD
ncbi:MAG: CDP-diacylglycerol--serine O-phosphatidyltransferase [Calditrichaeota bacterium]|nr:CDP-diacylglycerol--serine O-phosphatidyltransferase [candidate division KSB1 bacterium]MCZ6819506.1 CDP-diacylglycerol--serine O-phosphatidyltransferase [Calditrichota bacterium]TDI87158.1 MAG: CDP-diacylglycerol--serine O-phosphatidyltransferase [Caldithrix sp.]